MNKDIDRIIAKIEDLMLETDLDVLLTDPFIENIVYYNHNYVENRHEAHDNPRYRNHIRLFLSNLYFHFKFILQNINNYETLVDFLCRNQSHNLRYLDAMVLHYEVELTPVLELFINRLHKELDKTGVTSYSYNYKNLKVRLLTDEYSRLMKLPDYKNKLSGYINLETNIKAQYWAETYRDKGDDLLAQVEMQIQKLRNLLDLGLLPDNPAKSSVPKKTKSTSSISSKKKTDFIKIISAMYDAGIFVDSDGNPASSKQRLMDDLGIFLNDDLSKYSTSLSQAKTRDDKTFLKPFKDIEKEALRYFNQVGE